MQTKVAHRYAKACFEFLGSDKKVQTVVEELARFETLVAESAELRQALFSRVFSRVKRTQIVEDLSAKMKLSAEAKRLLSVISEMGRLRILKQIIEQLRMMMFERAGAIPIQIRAATELETEDRDLVVKKFAGLLGRKVEPSFTLDSSLMGGIKVTAGGRTYDGSITGMLDSMRETLIGGST